MEPHNIVVRGARQHNLKNVTVRIPKKRLVVLSGVSGSGKSSLALDTLYAEGQRRYVESLSSYARQFLGQMDKPLYDTIQGLSPTISVDQKSASHNPRSTVGTITEISDYLRVLYARVGEAHCPRCGRGVSAQSAQEIVEELAQLPVGARFLLLAPVIENRRGEFRSTLEGILRRGFSRARIDGEVRLLEEVDALDKRKKHDVQIVVDRLSLRAAPDDAWRSRVTDSVETALREGDGIVMAAVEGEASDRTYSEKSGCPRCGFGFPELSPQLFSFNSPQGMCKECNGLGARSEVDEDLVVPDLRLSINEGAVAPWGRFAEREGWEASVIRAVAKRFAVDLDRPWNRLAAAKRKVVLTGAGRERVSVAYQRSTRHVQWEGILNLLSRRMRETSSDRARRYYARYFSSRSCRACGGSRLRPEAIAVTLGGRTIADISSLAIEDALEFMGNLELEGAALVIGAELLKEIRNRLRFLADVGLGYLSLDRLAPSLSGGESQRIRLASQIGSELTGVIYILDEPSIGLHFPRQRQAAGSAAPAAGHREHGGGRRTRPGDHRVGGPRAGLRPRRRGVRRRGRRRGHARRNPERPRVAHRALFAGRSRHRRPAPATPLLAGHPGGGGAGEQPQGRGRPVPDRHAHLRHRGLRRGQEHAGVRGALPGARPRPPPLGAPGGAARPHRGHRADRPGGGH